MTDFEKLTPPTEGSEIKIDNGKLVIPDDPIIPFIEGDGIGPDIWAASVRVFDAAVEKAFGGKKKICWLEIFAGEKAVAKYGDGVWMPEDTFKGVPSPVKSPEKMNVVIFRENTEDVYAGIEWIEGSDEAVKVISWLNNNLGTKIRTDSGIGIKPISVTGTKRLVRKAINYAIDRGLKSVTLMHKGNIMKFTEGAFKDWGYELAREEFPDETITEDDLWSKHDGKVPDGKIVIKDRIADSMFQQILTRADEYDVIATPNLNGDYISDACAAQIGGLGMAPGANIGDYIALFEATHGTAPQYAGQDKVNPGSVILSGCSMFEYLGWNEAANVVYRAIEKTINQKRVTYDLERQMEGATKLSCSEFGSAIIENME